MITHFCTGLHRPEVCAHQGLMIPEWEESALGQPVHSAGAQDANGYNTALQKNSPHLEGLEVSGCQHLHGSTWMFFLKHPVKARRSWQIE